MVLSRGSSKSSGRFQFRMTTSDGHVPRSEHPTPADNWRGDIPAQPGTASNLIVTIVPAPAADDTSNRAPCRLAA